MDENSGRDERDLKAMCWTINALREDVEFESFVEVIPGVVAGYDYSAKWLMDALMNHDDISIKLGYRIPRLLASCNTGNHDAFIAQKRAITCLKAIWSLTMLSMPKPVTGTALQPRLFRESLKFREDMFDLLFNVRKAILIPEVEEHILSVSVVVARSLMDMQMDRAVFIEAKLIAFLATGKLSEDFHAPFYKRTDLLESSKYRVQALEEQVMNCQTLTTPAPHVMIEAIALHHTRMVSLIVNTDFGLEKQNVDDVLQSIRETQATLNQAGLNLALEFIGRMLESDRLPHEAFNTLRRVFFRINFRQNFSRFKFNRESQERLVMYLEEAVDLSHSGAARLPQSIISILLSFTRALSEPTFIMKAIGIIRNYSKVVPEETAGGVLLDLEKALPDAGFEAVEKLTLSEPKLDLFSSHLYTDAKPLRKVATSRTSTLSTVT